MSPYEVLAAWAIKMAGRLEQQRAESAKSAGTASSDASPASRGGVGRTA
jgi:hypothetical protein